MTLLEANLRALEGRFPDLAQALRSAPPIDQGQWSRSRTGAPTVTRRGVSLVSRFDPVEEARRFEVAPRHCLVVLGLGAGYLAEAVAHQHPESVVVIAESDVSWFREVLTHRDLSALWSLDRVVPLLGAASVVGEFLDGHAWVDVGTVSSRAVADQESEWAAAVGAEVDAAQTRARVNTVTYARFGALWQRNLARNEARAQNVRALAVLRDHWRGAPAVIAAAGPSLTHALDWMKVHRPRFVLIGVDTAWPALAAHGLAPDVLVVLDGQYANARHVDLVPPPSTLVVTEWVGPPRAFALAPERTYVAASSVSFLRRRERLRWGELGALPSGGSVATAAWSLALHLGCTEVAFAGLDLGYPHGQTHVPGSQFEEATHRRASRLRPAETAGLGLRSRVGESRVTALSGGTVLSDARMDLFRQWLSRAVARSSVKAYNLGRDGSLVPHLLSPGPGYGDAWPVLTSHPVPVGEFLAPKTSVEDEPPFAVIEEALRRLDGAAAQHAWKAAEAYWGAEVWHSWAARAWSTWTRFPSAFGLETVRQVLTTVLDWRRFWTPPDNSANLHSRSEGRSRQ